VNNPIIQREFIGLMRTRRALAMQVGLILALAAMVLLRWPSDAKVDLTGTQSIQVLQLFGYGLMVALILLAPIVPATAMVREKQQGTLELLLNSPMSPASILLGKLLGVLGFLLLMLALSLPAAAACYAMGGVTMPKLFIVYLILTLLSVQFASLGLLVSSYSNTTDAALRFTYGWILVLAVVVLGPHQFLHGLVEGPAATAIDWIRCLSPVPAMMHALGHGGVGSAGLIDPQPLWQPYAILAVIQIAIYNGLTIRRLGQRMFDRPRAQGRITDEQSTGVRIYRRLMYLWFFDPQRRSKLIGPLANPVMVKEFRCRRLGRAHWIMRLFALSLIASLGLMLATSHSSMDWGVRTLGGIIVILQIALVVLVTPSLASGLISGERESGGWNLLKMTPLPARSVVLGKLGSVAWTLCLLLLATMPAYLMLIAIDNTLAPVILTVLLTLVLTALFAILLSAALSSLCARTAPATAMSYGILITLCAGTMFIWLLRDAPFSHGVVEKALTLNPLAAALRLMLVPGFDRYELVPGAWYFLGGGALVSLFVLVYRTWVLSRPQ
jgi:ABC-type transport system involved in multi-copper enzyme maturation permease subunit